MELSSADIGHFADNTGTIYLSDGATNYGLFFQDSNRFFIQSQVSDADMLFRGSDAGTVFTALTLDMSEAGAATFSSSVLGSIINAGVFSSVGIGTATADANVAELGSGYLNLGRDDTADAVQIAFSKNGILHSSIVTDNNDLRIKGNTSNLGIRFDGSDNGSNITALRLDMSAAGAATFNSTIGVGVAAHATIPVSAYAPDASGNLKLTRAGTSESLTLGTYYITASGNDLNLSTTGDLTLDAAGDIILDADGGDLEFKDGAAGTLHSWKQGVYRILEKVSGTQYNNSIHNHTNNYQYVLGGTNGLILGDNVDQANRIIVDNGLQIAFDVNGVSTAKFTQYGGIAFGSDNSAATTLDDYEEGTFTPTVIGTATTGTATYSHQKGVYTKIGNVVTIQIYLNWSSGTGAGVLRFSNLPFTLYATSGFYANATIGEHSGIAGTAGHTLCGIGLPNTVQIQFAENDFNSAPSTTAYDAAGYILLSMTYIAA